VLGMNDTKITLSENDIKDRFPVGHLNGSEIETAQIPDVLAGAGAFRSTGNDMLKYLSANLGLLHTTLDDSIQLTHLIRHGGIIANPMNYSEYLALGWRVLTDLRTEVIGHQGSINGWNAFIGFIPSKQIGVILLCSCDPDDVDMNNLGFVLLNLAGIGILDKDMDGGSGNDNLLGFAGDDFLDGGADLDRGNGGGGGTDECVNIENESNCEA
jgi:CubicO group peptidase (beta-lactamase class C family)